MVLECVFHYRWTIFHTSFHLIDLHNLLFQCQKLMMMGTTDDVVKTPKKGIVFVEDLPKEVVVVVVSFNS